MNTALITGASSGSGAAFARKLAARGRNVLLVARSEDKLITLCNELVRMSGVRAQYCAIDLLDPDAGAQSPRGADAIVCRDPNTRQTLMIRKPGIYQVDVYASPETPQDVTLKLGEREFAARWQRG